MKKLKKNIFPIGLYAFVGLIILIPALLILEAVLILNVAKIASIHISIVFFLNFLILMMLVILITDISYLSKRRGGELEVLEEPIKERIVTVVLTAYNDELSIGKSVEDFINHPNVKRVLVIDNNSSDGTFEKAMEANAIVFKESIQGYGRCVHRALFEASKFIDTELIVLCEGDMTFRARDIEKLLAYESHGDIVNGTRISEQLRMPDTQLTNFIYFGNFFVGKLLELKHLGKGTLTDVGTTYKLCKSAFIRDNLHRYNPAVNHEFNAHFLDRSLEIGAKVIEVPITFYKRVGVSKGGNSSNRAAIRVGIKMIIGILFGWPKAKEGIHGRGK
jgi:glycosyltransferase involved in cell wall biosynthesis